MSRNVTDIRKSKAILALLSQPTIEAAAQEVGVTRKTLHQWLKDDDFKTKLQEAKKETVGHVTMRLRVSMSEAIDTLIEVMRDPESSANARVSAAKTILESGLKAHELEDLATKLEVMEQQIHRMKEK